MVIIAAGPFTLRRGRRLSRSITTPSTPDPSMVATKATNSTANSGNPVRMTLWPVRPNISSTPKAMKLPTMKTLK